jgi:uncharacterized protein (DUF1697 family)
MAKYVALLRAVNVAGHARVSAADLVQIFTRAGARDVSSFGHAGNLLFSAAKWPAAIAAGAGDEMRRRYGERPIIVLRSAAQIRDLIASNPFADCGATASDKLYVVFLARKARKPPALPIASHAERLEAFACRGRDVLLVSRRKPNGFYGFPNAFVETEFRVSATARNWTTVTRIAKLLA